MLFHGSCRKTKKVEFLYKLQVLRRNRTKGSCHLWPCPFRAGYWVPFLQSCTLLRLVSSLLANSGSPVRWWRYYVWPLVQSMSQTLGPQDLKVNELGQRTGQPVKNPIYLTWQYAATCKARHNRCRLPHNLILFSLTLELCYKPTKTSLLRFTAYRPWFTLPVITQFCSLV